MRAVAEAPSDVATEPEDKSRCGAPTEKEAWPRRFETLAEQALPYLRVPFCALV